MLKNFLNDERGNVAIYIAFFCILALSAGSISVDLGRLVTLKAQMQHRADASAIAGAVWLDGTDGARQRAKDVAEKGSSDSSNISSGSSDLSVATVNFYSTYSATTGAASIATNDRDAQIIEVILTPKLIDFFFTPFFGVMLESFGSVEARNVNATAVAAATPLMCASPPLMVCDLTETGGEDLQSTSNAGRQLLLKTQGPNATWAPGNFGYLESGYGPGANNLEQALADVSPPGCISDQVTTEPGNIANKGKRGVNARFNGSSHPYPAPNVVSYGRDSAFDVSSNGNSNPSNQNDRLGAGDWDLDAYWTANHPGDSDAPSALNNATRYQTYLYELGETYAKKGKHTIYPAPDDLPHGYTRVNPRGDDIPANGEPDSTPAPNGADRRVMEVVILKCGAQNVKGRGDYRPEGFIEVFITEPLGGAPDTELYGELIGPVTPNNSSNYHGNAGLIK